jgi:hypothetical protein
MRKKPIAVGSRREYGHYNYAATRGIPVEGVNDEGMLTGVVDIVIDRLRQEVRV